MQIIEEPCRYPHPEVFGMARMTDLIDQYIDERVARGELNGDSPTVIRGVLKAFARHVAHLEPIELTEADVDSWIADADLKPATRNGMVNKLKPFVRWLAARDHIGKDFLVTYKAPKVPQGMPRHLEGDQVRALVRACRTSRDRLIVLLMVHLGLRRIEVSRIDMEDIDFNGRLLGVRGKNGRGAITRMLPFDAEVQTALDAYLAECPASSGPLVRLANHDRRLRERAISDVVAELMRATGIKKINGDGMSAHALRHTCAQELIDSGVEIRLVQTALGHRSLTTTEGYLRRQPPGLREAMGGRSYA
jgi:site-specific recombinase XerD